MDDARGPDVEPIRRRTTWQHTDDSSSQLDRHDDDALADALAAEVAAVTSSIPVINGGARTASYSEADLFAALMDDAQPQSRVELPQEVAADQQPFPFAAFMHETRPEPAVEEPTVVESPAGGSALGEFVTDAQTESATPTATEPPAVAEAVDLDEGFLPSVPPVGASDEPGSSRVSMPPQYAPSQGEWRDLALYPFPSAIDSSSPDPEPVLAVEPETATETETEPGAEAPVLIDAAPFAPEHS